jgi:hypothetical protein
MSPDSNQNLDGFSEYLKMKGLKYMLAPKNLCIDFMFVGNGMEVTVATLSSDNLYVPSEHTYPKNSTFLIPNFDFDNFKYKFLSRHLSKTFPNFTNASAHPLHRTNILSWITIIHSRKSLKISRITAFNTIAAGETPSGMNLGCT